MKIHYELDESEITNRVFVHRCEDCYCVFSGEGSELGWYENSHSVRVLSVGCPKCFQFNKIEPNQLKDPKQYGVDGELETWVEILADTLVNKDGWFGLYQGHEEGT